MAKSFSGLTKNWSSAQHKAVQHLVEESRSEENARQEQLYVDFDADTRELVQTAVLANQMILVELRQLRDQNAQLLERVECLEMLVRRQELQPA